mgnify:CR=1 FL=1
MGRTAQAAADMLCACPTLCCPRAQARNRWRELNPDQRMAATRLAWQEFTEGKWRAAGRERAGLEAGEAEGGERLAGGPEAWGEVKGCVRQGTAPVTRVRGRGRAMKHRTHHICMTARVYDCPKRV